MIEERVLFGPSSNSQYSESFMVYPGSTVIIRAWNIGQFRQPEDDTQFTNVPQEIFLQQVDYGEVVMVTDEAEACECERRFAQKSSIKYAEDCVTCCTWSLSACNNVLMLTAPGTYRLRIDDLSTIGEVYVKMFRGPSALMGTI